MKMKIIIPAALGLLILFSTALWVIQKAGQARGRLPLLYELPSFEFTTADSQKFGLNQLSGKISLFDFIYTSCPGPCPRMSATMAVLYEQFSDAAQVQFVSVSVDPGRDSLSVLRRYRRQYGVIDQRWFFLQAPIEAVIRLYEEGFHLGGFLPVEHSTKFILVDDRGRIRGYYDSTDAMSMNILRTHIVELIRMMK